MNTHVKNENVSKYVYFIVNLACIMLLVARHWNVPGLVIATCLQIYAYRIMIAAKEQSLASSYLAGLLFIDLLSFFGVYGTDILDNSANVKISSFATGSISSFLLLLGVGIGFLWYGNHKKEGYFAEWIGTLLTGFSIILYFWSDGNLLHPSISANGICLLYAYAILTIIWFLAIEISYRSQKKIRSRFTTMTFLLIACIFAVILRSFTYVDDLTTLFIHNFEVFKDTMFAWYKIIPAATIFIALAFTMEHQEQSVNSFTYLFIGGSLLLSKLLFEQYFTYHFILLLIFCLLSLKLLSNEVSFNKTLGYDNRKLLMLLFLFMVFTIFMVKQGLWFIVLVTIIFLLYVVRTGFTFEELTRNDIFWLSLIIYIFVTMLVWIGKAALSKDTCGMLIYSFLFIFAIMYILNQCLMHHKQAMMIIKSLVCLSFLFLAYSIGYTSSTKISTDNIDDNKVEIALHEKGNTKIVKAYYYWTDGFHQKLTDEKEFNEAAITIPVEGEKLVIVTKNSDDIRTINESWYPFGISELKKSTKD